jgi:peroxiredoxin Q/BCP
VGDLAPDFRLPSSRGGEDGPSAYWGRQILVLYFYPKDDTPGCTAEACAFRDLAGEFASRGAAVAGVSPDSLRSHARFVDKHRLPFPLLADDGSAIAQRYGVWQEKSLYGRRYMGIVRTTFVIDREGVIRFVYPRVSVTGHAKRVLNDVESLGGV